MAYFVKSCDDLPAFTFNSDTDALAAEKALHAFHREGTQPHIRFKGQNGLVETFALVWANGPSVHYCVSEADDEIATNLAQDWVKQDIIEVSGCF